MIESTITSEIKIASWKSLQDCRDENENLKVQVLALQSKLDDIDRNKAIAKKCKDATKHQQ